jgi:hypothetical protein
MLETSESGKTTGTLHELGTETVDEIETTTTAELGTGETKVNGIEVGILLHEMTTPFGDEAMVITWLSGMLVAHEAGMTIGLSQVDGTTTVAGTKTKFETGTVVINDNGTETTTFDGTDDGTFSYETIASDGDEAMMINWVAGNDET